MHHQLHNQHHEPGQTTTGRGRTRRDILKAALALAATPTLLAACASAPNRHSNTATPNGTTTQDLINRWNPRRSALEPADPRTTDRNASNRATRRQRPSITNTDGIIPRHAWASEPPAPRHMDPMTPVRRITFHHSAIRFDDTSTNAVASHIDAIRRAHRNRPTPFGDIGYHYLIDPAGRVWQGRSLDYQGAHVGGQNPANLGICVLGNFETQQPNADQDLAIGRFLAQQMAQYRVPHTRVHTHRELAPTACPGRFLQPRLADIRARAARLRIS